MQKVDPFIAVKNPPAAPIGGRSVQPPQSRRLPVRGRSIDGLRTVPRPTAVREPDKASQTGPKPLDSSPQPVNSDRKETFLTEAQATPDPVSPRPKPTRAGGVRRALKILSQVVILITLIGLGFLLRSVVVGQAVIFLYAVFAFVFRVESRITFTLVLISFTVVLAAFFRSDAALANVFAVYAFLLLIVGTLTLGREVRNEI